MALPSTQNSHESNSGKAASYRGPRRRCPTGPTRTCFRSRKTATAAVPHSAKRFSWYVLYRLVWMGALIRTRDDLAGADRPCPAPSAQLLVEGAGGGGGRHHPAHPQGRALIDPVAQIIPPARGSGVMQTALVFPGRLVGRWYSCKD
jgi:hypothetical protein